MNVVKFADLAVIWTWYAFCVRSAAVASPITSQTLPKHRQKALVKIFGFDALIATKTQTKIVERGQAALQPW